MNAKERARREVWDLLTCMEKLQESYRFVSRDLPDGFGVFYEGCMSEIEFYDEELKHEHDTETT